MARPYLSQVSSHTFAMSACGSLCETKSTTSSFVITSQIPSHASTINSSSGTSCVMVTSGSAVTICCSGVRWVPCLNSKSPMALLSARLPWTRPPETVPPARHDASCLLFVCGLVVKRKRHSLATTAQHTSAVTCVPADKLAVRGDDERHSCAAT